MIKELKRTAHRVRGFTLIELLVVIGILAVLLAIVLIAVNPPRQFILARNTQRRSDALAILNGVGQYFAENGTLPANIATGSAQAIKSSPLGDVAGDICGRLSGEGIVGPDQSYLAQMPIDPLPNSGFEYTDCTNYDSGYTIVRSSNNRVTVTAPNSEDPDGGPNGPTISVTR